MKLLINYGRMIKFSHSIFALPFAGISILLVFYEQDYKVQNPSFLVFLIIVCMISLRSASMGFNRIVDENIDSQNQRTQSREIPVGKIKKKTALFFVFFSSVLFHIASYFINPICFYLSFPTLWILFFYSYTKRFSFLCHYYLGFCIGLVPLATWLALTNSFDLLPILWGLGLMFSIAGFDILYSLQDIEIDKKLQLHSIPIKFGKKKSFFIAGLTQIFSVFIFIAAAFYSDLSFIFYIFLFFTALSFFYEHRIAFQNQNKLFPPLFYQLHSFIGICLFLGILCDKIKN